MCHTHVTHTQQAAFVRVVFSLLVVSTNGKATQHKKLFVNILDKGTSMYVTDNPDTNSNSSTTNKQVLATGN